MSFNGIQRLTEGFIRVGELVVRPSPRPVLRRPVTRTRRQWADFLVLWYTVYGATRWQWLRVGFTLWWLGMKKKLDEPCTIYLDPEAFGVTFKRELVCPRRKINWPGEPMYFRAPGDSGDWVLR